MKVFIRTLLICAVSACSAGLPALSAEQLGSANYDDFSFADSLAVLPATAESVAIAPALAPPGDDTVAVSVAGPDGGAGMPIGGEGGALGAMRMGEEKWHGGWRHEHGGMLGWLEGPLAVTDDQYEKLHSLRNAYLDKVAPKMAVISVLKRQMKDAITSASMDPKAVTAIGSQIISIKSDIETAKLENRVASAQVLTADQRKAIHERMIRHEAGEMEEHGKWGKHGGMHGHH